MARTHGSQPDMFWLVNNNTEEFKRAIRNCHKDEWNCANIEFLWPLKEDNYAEFSITDDRIWSGLGSDCPEDIKNHSFWPSSGAKWDAAAILTRDNKKTLLLFEAKAHKGELMREKKLEDIIGDTNRKTIINSLTAIWEKLSPNKTIIDWLKSYQFANRVAHVKHLNDEMIETVLIYVLFCNEKSNFNDVADMEGWEKKLNDEYCNMGLSNDAKELKNFYYVVYPEAPSIDDFTKTDINIDKKQYKR